MTESFFCPCYWLDFYNPSHRSINIGFQMKTDEGIVQLLISIAVVAIGLLNMPYGYYVSLKIVLCVVLLRQAFLHFEENNLLWISLLAVAVLYNPVFQIHLGSKVMWSVSNIATVLLIAYSLRLVNVRSKSGTL